MKTGWILYDRPDYEINRMFAEHMQSCARALGLSLSVVFSQDVGNALSSPPDFAVSRQRDPHLSRQLEAQGIPVFNNARVCEICNDKRNTHRFLEGLPRMQTVFAEDANMAEPCPDEFPLVVKPAFGHGGDRVAKVNDWAELTRAVAAIHPDPALIQALADGAGRDLRVYVLFGEIKAAVMRTAQEGIVSNYKKGGHVALHQLAPQERDLTEKVIRRFADENALLSFAGIDLIYHHGQPVVNEVEDVVGSRMLYKVSDLDIVSLYMEGIASRLSA